MVEIIEASAVVFIALFFIQRCVRERRDYRMTKIIDFCVGLTEEGIAYSEDKNRIPKREAATNIGKAVQKLPVEQVKDQVQVDKFFQAGMVPIRQIAHDIARQYIMESIQRMPDGWLKESVGKVMSKCVDDGIRMRIAAAKMLINDPLRPLFYRSV